MPIRAICHLNAFLPGRERCEPRGDFRSQFRRLPRFTYARFDRLLDFWVERHVQSRRLYPGELLKPRLALFVAIFTLIAFVILPNEVNDVCRLPRLGWI